MIDLCGLPPLLLLHPGRPLHQLRYVDLVLGLLGPVVVKLLLRLEGPLRMTLNKPLKSR